MGRDENVTVFKDTEKLCKTNPKLSESVKRAVAAQKLILEGDLLAEQDKGRYKDAANVIVSKKRTLEAAAAYKNQHVAVHNFASASNPGGGVTKGANAQEECLCRCSDLYFCLNAPAMWGGFYMPHREAHDPIHNDDIIYTPGVVVLKKIRRFLMPCRKQSGMRSKQLYRELLDAAVNYWLNKDKHSQKMTRQHYVV